MDAIAHFPCELHALIASYVGVYRVRDDDDGAANAWRALVGDAEDWVVCTAQHGNGTVSTVTLCNGLLHSRRDEPAEDHCEYGAWFLRCWYRCGKLHRDGDRPAYVYRYHDGRLESRWYRDGMLHRAGGQPAVINPVANQTQWWENGVLIKSQTRWRAVRRRRNAN